MLFILIESVPFLRLMYLGLLMISPSQVIILVEILLQMQLQKLRLLLLIFQLIKVSVWISFKLELLNYVL